MQYEAVPIVEATRFVGSHGQAPVPSDRVHMFACDDQMVNIRE